MVDKMLPKYWPGVLPVRRCYLAPLADPAGASETLAAYHPLRMVTWYELYLKKEIPGVGLGWKNLAEAGNSHRFT